MGEKETNAILYVLPIVVIVGLILILTPLLTAEPKTPVTSEQMWDVLVDHGYEPHDLTESYLSDYPSAKLKLNKCFAIQKNDLHLEFYDYVDMKSAASKNTTARSYILENKMSVPYAEHDTRLRNYCIYTLTAGGEYSVALYVENTAIYAYCHEENANALAEIMYDIGYFEPSNVDNGLVLIALFAVLSLIDSLGCRWLWFKLCDDSSKEDVDETLIPKMKRYVFRSVNATYYNWKTSKTSIPIKAKIGFVIFHVFAIVRWLGLILAIVEYCSPLENVAFKFYGYYFIKVFVIIIMFLLSPLFSKNKYVSHELPRRRRF